LIIPTETDLPYRTASNILYFNAGCDLLVPTGCTYTGTRIQHDTSETGSITIDGTLTAETHLYSPTAITITGTLPASAVNIDDGSGTCDVTLSGTANLTFPNIGIHDFTHTGTNTISGGNVRGDIDNSGTLTFSAYSSRDTNQTITNTGTLTFGQFDTEYDDTVVDFFGDMALGNISRFNGAGQVLTFEHGKTYSFTGLETAGTLAKPTTIQSDSAGDRFTFNNISGGEVTTSYLDVKDCEVSGDNINAIRSVNSGNTDYRDAEPHWIFWAYQQAFVTELATV
jgi:hypothetical protein